MGINFKIFLIFGFLHLVAAIKWQRLVDPAALHKRKHYQTGIVRDELNYKWDTGMYPNMPVDHFSDSNMDKFSVRYLYNFTYFNKDNGTIFFYTGNEGVVDGFAKATGIMWDLAPMFNAALVFMEHRYYGQSLPYGDDSYKDVAHLGYLNSIQALADFAEFIPHLKSDILKCKDTTPVIAFGGSYGGMLTAWMRIKYPHIINGGWSGSSPLLYYQGGNTPDGAFDKVTTRTFVDAGCSREAITKGWDAITNLGKTAEGLQYMNDLFHIAAKSKLTKAEDAEYVKLFVREAIEYMGMVDYPYSTDFLMPDMPAWPAKEFCKNVAKVAADDKAAVLQMFNAASVYYNSSGDQKEYCIKTDVCDDTATAGLGSPLGWPWLACTEQIMNACAQGGDNDFFWNECTGYAEANVQYCNATFFKMGYKREMTDPNAIPNLYGINFAALSNMIFTNGYLDPWSSGGVYETSPGIQNAKKNGVYTFLMQGAAHHLDLRQPNTCDPPPVRNARFQIVNILKCFAYGCDQMPEATPLPDFNGDSPNQCSYEFFAYPWNQVAQSTAAPPQSTTSASPKLLATCFTTLLLTMVTLMVLLF